MDTEELARLVARLRNEKGWSQEQLGRKASVTREWVSLVEGAKRKRPDRERLERVAHALDVPPSTLLALAGYRVARLPAPPRPTMADLLLELQVRLRDIALVPIRGHIPAGELFPEEEQAEGTLPLPKVWLRGATRPYLLIVNGDSMAGNLESGDLVLVDPDGQWANGKVVVVRVEHETTVKRIFRDNDKVRLVPDNKKHKAIEVKEQDVTVLGLVIKRIRAEDL